GPAGGPVGAVAQRARLGVGAGRAGRHVRPGVLGRLPVDRRRGAAAVVTPPPPGYFAAPFSAGFASAVGAAAFASSSPRSCGSIIRSLTTNAPAPAPRNSSTRTTLP